MRTLFLDILVMIILLIVLDSCSPRVYNPAIRHGATYSKSTNGPEISKLHIEKNKLHARFDAVGFIDLNGQSVLRIAAAIDSMGLKFDNKTARLAIKVHLKGTIDTTTYDTLSINQKEFRQTYHYYQNIYTTPGDYRVKLILNDLISGNRISKRAITSVPDPAVSNVHLGDVRVEGKQDGGSWQPLAGYDIPSRIDSLRFTLRVNNDTTGSPLLLRAQLVRFRADSSYAHPYSWSPGHPPSMLVYKGIDYNDSMVINKKRRVLRISGAVQVRFPFRRPPRGNYRFEVKTGTSSHQLFKARDFAIRSLNFPAVLSPRERAAPLIYLMQGRSIIRKKKLVIKVMSNGNMEKLRNLMKRFHKSGKNSNDKYKAMMAIHSRNLLRKAVRHFWQAHIGDSAKARKVAAMYYRWVERANRLFTNYKEGWKTDKGFCYILFGPPLQVEICGIPYSNLLYHYKNPIHWVYYSGYLIHFLQPVSSSANYPLNIFY